MTLFGKTEKLREYAELENTEIGEYWMALVDLAIQEENMSENLKNALIEEVDQELQDIDENWKIIEETSTEIITTKSLAYKG